MLLLTRMNIIVCWSGLSASLSWSRWPSYLCPIGRPGIRVYHGVGRRMDVAGNLKFANSDKVFCRFGTLDYHKQSCPTGARNFGPSCGITAVWHQICSLHGTTAHHTPLIVTGTSNARTRTASSMRSARCSTHGMNTSNSLN